MATDSSPNGRNQRGVRVQVPLVDTVSCYCRVDAGLKTVAGARRFVPGAKICTQPDINPNGPRSRTSRRERSRTQSPFIPGLPDDIAIACLVRVPRSSYQNLRLVSRSWNRLLTSNFFYSLRKKCGTIEEFVYVIRRDGHQKLTWQAYDPIYQLWLPLPPIPSEFSEVIGFECAVLSGCYLYLFGGKDPVKGSLRRVIFYNARTNKWHRAPAMQRKRHSFGACVINNRLYVAGGECEGTEGALKSTEVYDPNKNRWSTVSEMMIGIVPFLGVVHNEKWLLGGIDRHRGIVIEVYDPKTNSWSFFDERMINGWNSPSISMYGKLYAMDCRDGCTLRVYDDDSNTWSKLTSGRVKHVGSSRSFEAVGIVSIGGKLGIVRNNMSIRLFDVLNNGKSMETNSKSQWEVIVGKKLLKTMVANLWSSIAGTSGMKNCVVHCQVLQA